MLQTSPTPLSRASLPISQRMDKQQTAPKNFTMPGQFATRAGIMELILQGAGIEGIHCDPGIEGNTDHSTPPSWDGGGMVITEAHEEPRNNNPDTDSPYGADDNSFS